MMLKEKSSPWACLKYLYVLPLAAIAVTAFARPEVSKTVEEISAVKVNDLAEIVETKAREIVERGSTILPKDSLKERDKSEILKGVTITANGPASGVIGEDSITVVGYGVNVQTKNGGHKPLIIINGIETVGEDPLGEINPDRIQSVTVFKSKDAVAIYGDKGKNGVMKIQLLPNDSVRSSTIHPLDKVEKLYNAPKSSAFSIRGMKMHGINLEKPLFIIDGKESLNDDPLATISPDRINSISVLKDKSAVAVYGEKGKNGAIIVTLLTEKEYQAKKNDVTTPSRNALELGLDLKKDYISAKNLVFFVNGKEVTATEAEKLLVKDLQGVNTSEDKEKETLNIHLITEKNSKSK